MISKEHPIEILQQALEYEEKQLEECYENIKSLKNRIAKDENYTREISARISGLKDAIQKLKGIANIERANKL